MKFIVDNKALSLILSSLLLSSLLFSQSIQAAGSTYIVDIISVGAQKAGKQKQLIANLTDTDEVAEFENREFVLFTGLRKEMLAILLVAISNGQQVEIVTDLNTPKVIKKGKDPVITQLRVIK